MKSTLPINSNGSEVDAPMEERKSCSLVPPPGKAEKPKSKALYGVYGGEDKVASHRSFFTFFIIYVGAIW